MNLQTRLDLLLTFFTVEASIEPDKHSACEIFDVIQDVNEDIWDLVLCALVAAKTAEVQSAVNWARVRCCGVSFSFGSYNDIGFEICICGASPSAHEIQQFVHQYLLKRMPNGFTVTVHTEW